ncbi:hypothetical protein DW726_05000 [Streptococcus gordonii]|uniref:DUF5965 family protein n=1 Tax=Streptococcus gordonii TaxID=1302 RepID=UPI000E4C549D|nr:DUF5965 family protein [Streptococcus gordonii]RHE64450.1 hypothetical protein DW726_05000 [Streptococcus gordonii]
MNIVERLEEKVAKQEQKVAKESEKLKTYKQQLETAMFATFVKRQSVCQMSFTEALDLAFGKEPELDLPENRNEEESI